jgi:hypothetical protein
VGSRRDADRFLAALALSLSASRVSHARLREENARRTRDDPEYELLDTGIFDGDRYWQITADYPKPRQTTS